MPIHSCHWHTAAVQVEGIRVSVHTPKQISVHTPKQISGHTIFWVILNLVSHYYTCIAHISSNTHYHGI